MQLDEIIAIDDALDRLDAVNERLAPDRRAALLRRIAEREIAEMLGVTTRTVERDWLKARLFLLRELGGIGVSRVTDSDAGL